MIKTIFILTITMLTGCSSFMTQKVHVRISSLKHSDILRDTPIVFIKHNDDFEKEKIEEECKKGAVLAGIKILNQCLEECYYVKVTGKTGETSSSIRSVFNPYYNYVETYSLTSTERKIQITMYSDITLTNIIYQGESNSSGEKNNVISVSKEMCQGLFESYPKQETDKLYKIKID